MIKKSNNNNNNNNNNNINEDEDYVTINIKKALKILTWNSSNISENHAIINKIKNYYIKKMTEHY